MDVYVVVQLQIKKMQDFIHLGVNLTPKVLLLQKQGYQVIDRNREESQVSEL